MEWKSSHEPHDLLPVGQVEVSVVFPHLDRAFDNGYSIISEQGGTRSSKTVTTMIWLCIKAIEKKIKCVILRKYFPSLRSTILQDFFNVMKQLGIWSDDQFKEAKRVYYFSNGSEFWFVAADESEKLKGLASDITWMNEATEFEANDFHQLNFRCAKMLILDYNPNFPENHWLLKEVDDPDTSDDYTGDIVSDVRKEHKRSYFFVTTYRDNPFLTKRQVAEIEQLKFSNYTLWRQFGEGQRCMLVGRVFENIKVVKEMPEENKKVNWYVGIDYGYSNQPTAIIKVGLCDKRCYVEEIEYRTGIRTSEIRDVLLTDKRVRNMQIIADSANELMNAEVEGERGHKRLTIKRVNKGGRVGGTKRLDAIRTMQQYEFTILGSSTNVTNEFESYVFKTEKDGTFSNRPVEFNDHAIDAIRYVIMERGIQPARKGVIMS